MCSRRKINLNITDFKQFRQGNYVYVDKSAFIEHLLDEGNTIMLFCRPRRMGKTMNLTMLRYFFDIKEEDTASLFKGLYIETKPIYQKRNSCPVIYLNFKSMSADNYAEIFLIRLKQELDRYLTLEQMSETIRHVYDNNFSIFYKSFSTKKQENDSEGFSGLWVPHFSIIAKNMLREATKNLYDVYGIKPYVLIDEYDKLIMDNINNSGFEDMRGFIKSVMSDTLKDNPYLMGAVITGVNRIAQESLFSDLNNITICDVFTEGGFDTDFGFTDEEVGTVSIEVSKSNQIKNNVISQSSLRQWYNNCRIGKEAVYFSFSVLSALQKGKLGNYWGQSGTMDMIRGHLTPQRVELITKLVNGFPVTSHETYLKDRLTVNDLKTYNENRAFYSLLVQSGYLTYEHILDEETLVPEEQRIFLPNYELQRVWREFIFHGIYDGEPQAFKDILRDIRDTKSLGLDLTEAMNNKLSFYDFEHSEPEKTYHVYVAGIMSALGYKWISNRESGLGRYDLAVSLLKYNLIFEFKVADNADSVKQSAYEAVKQIQKKRYMYDFDKNKPIFLIGIGFYKKLCWVEAEKLCPNTIN